MRQYATISINRAHFNEKRSVGTITIENVTYTLYEDPTVSLYYYKNGCINTVMLKLDDVYFKSVKTALDDINCGYRTAFTEDVVLFSN